MNWVDGIIIGVFVFYLFEGVERGFVEQALELVGFALTIVVALALYRSFAGWIEAHVGIQRFAAEPIAFFASWFFFQVIYSLILRLTYPLVPKIIRDALPNRLAGLLPAFAKAVIIIALILTVVVILPVPGKLKAEIDDSQIGARFVDRSGQVEGYLNKVFGRDLKNSLTFLTVPAQTEEIIKPDERVELKFTTSEVTVDRETEQQMLILINQERNKAGLPGLGWDEATAEVARAHSKDMFEQGYFSHQNQAGQSPFDRMEKAGIKFGAAGENIAYASTLELAHNGLMRSPGHRANILSDDFKRIGIGVMDGGIYGKMFGQDFLD